MKDWKAYIEGTFNTDMWGFVCIDYYFRSPLPPPSVSDFIDTVLSWVGERRIDAVSFHNVLLSLSLQLSGNDLELAISKSKQFVATHLSKLSTEQLQKIVQQYEVYGKSVVMAQELIGLGRSEIRSIAL